MFGSANHTLWRPRPIGHDHKDYYAGYSDGFHRARYGAGMEDPATSYRQGYKDAQADLVSEMKP